MRLLTKTTLYFLLAMIPLLGLTGYLLFEQFNRQLNQRTDKELVDVEMQWVEYLETSTLNGSRFMLQTPDLLIYPSEKTVTDYPTLSTIYGTKANKGIQIPFRQLTDVVNINGTAYEIMIRQSQEQKLVLVRNIILIMLFVFVGLLLATILFNWFISKRLWKPFQTSLQKIRNIELPRMSKIHFEDTSIKEFNGLNASLNTMVDKIYSDYINMKEFTEDAAHEMQTPLAVAQTKLELLLQDTSLTAPQTEIIMQATTALQRLSKLNQSLLLLAKIENHQYEPGKPIDLAEVTKKYLRLFDEIIKDKQIEVRTEFAGSFDVKLHPFLADSLISNLLGNAIKYNYDGGVIVIAINNHQYCISNTSSQDALDVGKLFKRFTGSTDKKQSSTGLGLAIVKRIIDTHQLQVSYSYKEDMHRFCVEDR